mgnify:FL=1
MNEEKRKEIKKRGIKRFINSFHYSWDGIKYAFKYEQSMFIHVLMTLLVVVCGIVLELNFQEWLLCIILIGLVIATELINTAIEAVVDLACPEIHPLAKTAKDTAAAAVFVFALTALLCGLFLFVPKIIALF